MKKMMAWVLVVMLLTACGNHSEKVIDQATAETDSVQERITEMVSQMTLEEKIEQMIILDYSGVPYGSEGESDVTKLANNVKDFISQNNFGGIILFRDNVTGTEQVLNLISDFQVAATKNNVSQKIPLFMCVDQEGGRVTRLTTGTSLPGNMALGAINDTSVTKEYATIIGRELKALGFNVDFAPVLDTNNNPSNPVIGVRSFSSDTSRVSKMGEAFIEGLHGEGIISTLKHFPGHGDTATDSHTGLPMIDKSYDEIKSLELIPFKAGIDKGAEMIMTAHIVYPQIESTKYISKKTGEEIYLPATLSKTILTGILRNDLEFDGIIVTDALNMAAIAEHFDKKDAAKLALNAGVDILLMPVSLASGTEAIENYVSMIVELVNEGEIPEETINDSVARILKLKQEKGLLDKVDYEVTSDQIQNALSIVGSKENHDKELEIAQKAITLVKGEEQLPIQEAGKVLILDAYANEKNNIEYAIQILKEQKIVDDDFEYEVDNYENRTFEELKNKIDSASIVIITANTYSRAYFDNTNEKYGWQGRFIDEAIREIHQQNKKVVLVSCMLPYDVARYEDADVILCAYGDKSIPNLPIEYTGETPTFGQNMTAAIMKLFSNEAFQATLPVDVFEVDNTYHYTNDKWSN